MDGYIYFIQAENGLIKVGISTDLNKRMRELCTQNAIRIKLIGCLKYKNIDNSALIKKERELHEMFKGQKTYGV